MADVGAHEVHGAEAGQGFKLSTRFRVEGLGFRVQGVGSRV